MHGAATKPTKRPIVRAPGTPACGPPVGDEVRGLDLVEPEHRERERQDDEGDDDEHGGLLQPGAEERAREGREDPERRVGDADPEDVREGEPEGTALPPPLWRVKKPTVIGMRG